MRINNVTRVGVEQPKSSSMSHSNFNNNYTGFFGIELKTCSTIEEALQSFDELEQYRKQEALRPFKYKG